MSTSTIERELSQNTIGALIKAFEKIEIRGRGVDYDLARWGKRVFDLCGLGSRRTMTDQLGLSGGKAAACLRRLEDLNVVQDRKVWIAVCWSRVRQIAKIDKASRAAVISRILSACGPSGITPDARANEILAPFVTPKPRQDEGRGKNGVARALEELAYLLENYDLPGYTPPEEVVEILNNI